MKVLNFGSLNLDFIYRVHDFVKPGQTLHTLSRRVLCGGKGLNQSVALQAGGACVFHGGCVGQDDGGSLLDFLAERQVDIRHVRKLDAPSGHTVIQVNDQGENCILLFGGANQAVEEVQIDATLRDFSPGDLLVTQNEISSMPSLMRKAKAIGMKLILNPSPIENVADFLPLELVDLFFVNGAEAAALACDAAQPEAALLERYPAAKIIVTYGSAGAAVLQHGKPRLWQDALKVKPVDTTGAGDTFLGYFVGRMAKGASDEECLRYATQAAALCVQRPGAAPSIPLLHEVEAAMKRQ